jgi:hypothetical protein
MSTLLAQDDFSSLGLAATGQDADGQALDIFHEFSTADRAGSAGSRKSDATCEADEIYHPVNFIPEEVYEMIRNWESSYIKQQEIAQAVDSMDMESFTNSQARESYYEPMRCMLESVESAPPPKRFFRTFWRSLTRRVVQHQKECCRDRAAMSSSDVSDDGSSACEAS